MPNVKRSLSYLIHLRLIPELLHKLFNKTKIVSLKCIYIFNTCIGFYKDICQNESLTINLAPLIHII